MSIQFNCPQCGKSLKAPDEFGGRKVRCTACKQVVVVPKTLAEHLEVPVPQPVAGDLDPEHEEEAPINFTKPRHEEELVDMTAMVDIVFFLLIFFLVTSVQSIQASIEMPAPDPDQGAPQGKVTVEALEQDDNYVIARIDKDNTVWVNDSEAPTRAEVISKLREAKDEHGSKSGFALIVMASGDCRHETVVMVLDAGAAAGIQGVRLANLSEDDL